jgi:hypothetical protein
MSVYSPPFYSQNSLGAKQNKFNIQPVSVSGFTVMYI